jgi:hypothetical protein
LRTALEARDPTCVVPGCNKRRDLEIDHIVPFAAGGETKLDNLARLCRWHHAEKPTTAGSYKAGPAAGNGREPPTERARRHAQAGSRHPNSRTAAGTAGVADSKAQRGPTCATRRGARGGLLREHRNKRCDRSLPEDIRVPSSARDTALSPRSR